MKSGKNLIKFQSVLQSTDKGSNDNKLKMKYLTLKKKGHNPTVMTKGLRMEEQALRIIHDLDYTSFELGDFRIPCD
jgi:hypothetical protein